MTWRHCWIHAKNGLGRHRNGGGVYDDLRIVEATHRLLADTPEARIPDDNRYPRGSGDTSSAT
jgi:CRISPR-associated endonuclease/helicase Cas3